jgi:hypothetical protein
MARFASSSPSAAATLLCVSLAACGARTGLDGPTPPPDAALDAAPDSPLPPSCASTAPQPEVLVSLTDPAHYGAASYALAGDASRLYTFVWGPPDANEYSPTYVLSIDPCTGDSIVLSSHDTTEPLAADGTGIYFQARGADAMSEVPLVWSDPLGHDSRVVANLSDSLRTLNVSGGRGYGVTGSTALVALALDGSAPTTLVPQAGGDLVSVWWDGAAVDDSYVYFYASAGLEKIPKAGGQATVILGDNGASACGGSEPAPDPYVVVDDAYVYLSGYDGLKRVAKDGSSTFAYPGTANRQCVPIAVDDTHIYFHNFDTATSASTIRRVPKAGGSVELVASTDDAGGIVVTATSIYWLDYTRAVMKMDKPR